MTTKKLIQETLIGTTVLATTVLFMAAAVIALYKAVDRAM